MTRAEELVALARSEGLMLATAESCTGGLIAGAITDVPGASDVFDRGLVTYSNTAKITVLGVDEATITQFGAVSEEVAAEMADGALRRSVADMTVAVTGIAGPGGSEHKPEGRVCFARAAIGVPTIVTTVEFGARGRGAVRQATVAYALDMLIEALQDG